MASLRCRFGIHRRYLKPGYHFIWNCKGCQARWRRWPLPRPGRRFEKVR